MAVYRFICFSIIFHVVKSYCEHGSYISGISNTEKCCVNCKTWYFLNKYFESSCPDFPYMCKSDNGIFLEPGYPSAEDQLSGFSTASIQCPSQVIVYSDKGVNSTSVLYNITSEGNIKDKSCTHPSGTSLQIGIHPVVCTAKNSETENMLECNFTIYVIDNHSPNLECPNVTEFTILGKKYANVTYEPVIWDNSGETLDPKCSLAQGSTLPIGTQSVICGVSDRSQNNNSCSFNNESPNFNCPNVTEFTILGKYYANVTYEPVVWDNSGEILEPNCSLAQGSLLSIGRHRVTCHVSDRSLNVNNCSGSIFVQDNESPSLLCPNVTVPTILGKNYANVTYEPVVWDNSGETLEPNCSLAQGSVLSIGLHRVTCHVSDRSLNVNNCSGSIFVQDNESPSLLCPNVTVPSIHGKNYANVTYEPVVWDNSGETLEPNCSLAQGSLLSIGLHRVTCHVSDRSLNVNNCSGSIFVQDNERPSLLCPNVTVPTIHGKNYANVTYEPVVWDNSGETLEPNCSLAQGSLLSIGLHRVTCHVSDRSLNVNNCSGSVLVQENGGGKGKSKNSRRGIALSILVPITVFVTVCVIASRCYICHNKQKKMSQQKPSALYNSRSGMCLVNMDKNIVNKGATFADFSFADLLSKEDIFTRVDISWKNKSGHSTKTIERGDFSRIMTVTGLTPNEDVVFKLTYHSDDSTQVQDNLQLKTHRNLSEIFGKCEFVDITYNSVRVKLPYAKEHLTCESMWLVIEGQCYEPDNLYNKYNTGDHCSEKKINAASGIIENIINDLIPGYKYRVFVELRTQNLLTTVKDRYNLGHVKTKTVSIKDLEVGSNKVTVVFNQLDPDCQLIAAMCCGKLTITDNCILTIENLQKSTSYALTYGAICNGKHLYHGQRTIFTAYVETDTCPGATCKENILEVFDECLNDVDTLITGMKQGKLFVERLAKALKFDKSIEALKYESSSCNYKTMFQGLMQNRKTCLDMNVDKFLELFISENEQQNGCVMGDEYEHLLTTDKESLYTFYQLIEKTHNCDYCQQLYFHSKIHDDIYIKNQLKYQESM